jgi:hypothetical protein
MSIIITVNSISKEFNKQQLIDNCDYFNTLFNNCDDEKTDLTFNQFTEEALMTFHQIFENHKTIGFPPVYERPLEWWEYEKASLPCYYMSMRNKDDECYFPDKGLIALESRYDVINNDDIKSLTDIKPTIFSDNSIFSLASYFSCHYIMMICALYANVKELIIDNQNFNNYLNLFKPEKMPIFTIKTYDDIEIIKTKKLRSAVLMAWFISDTIDLLECENLENVYCYSRGNNKIIYPKSVKNICDYFKGTTFQNKFEQNIDLLIVNHPILNEKTINVKEMVILDYLEEFTFKKMKIDNLYVEITDVHEIENVISKNASINILLKHRYYSGMPVDECYDFIKNYLGCKQLVKDKKIKSFISIDIDKTNLNNLLQKIMDLSKLVSDNIDLL